MKIIYNYFKTSKQFPIFAKTYYNLGVKYEQKFN